MGNKDMIARVTKEEIPFGLWGLTALRDDTHHPDLRILDVETFDPLWIHETYMTKTERQELIYNLKETFPETNRFDWFFQSDPKRTASGIRLIKEGRSVAY